MFGKAIVVGATRWKAQNGVERARVLILVPSTGEGRLGYAVIEPDADPSVWKDLRALPGIYELEADIVSTPYRNGPRLYVRGLRLVRELLDLEDFDLKELV